VAFLIVLIMISFIVGGIILFWILLKRFSQDGKVEGQPLGMPRGTVRALITIMIVAFPFWYIITGEEIPGLIVNAIFVAVAFYFEARRTEHEKLKQIVDEVKRPELVEIDLRKQKMPLYLPKYSVRILLVIMLLTFLITNYFGPQVPFQGTNTIFDLLIIIVLFIIGAILRSILSSRENKRIERSVESMDASLSDVEIIEKLLLEDFGFWKRYGKSIVSIVMLIVVVGALICYTFEWDYELITLSDYTLSLVGVLLLLTNAYYGFRD
jgi:hypothetical protein